MTTLNEMKQDAERMIKQPLHLIEMILIKHQEAILEVCKEQQEQIEALRRKSEMDEAMLAGNGALITWLKAELAHIKENYTLCEKEPVAWPKPYENGPLYREAKDNG